MTTRLPMDGRGRLLADPRGAQVRFRHHGRDLLGDVIGTRFDPVTGTVRLAVQHFDGSPWPVQPPARAVDVLERHECDDGDWRDGVEPGRAASSG